MSYGYYSTPDPPLVDPPLVQSVKSKIKDKKDEKAIETVSSLVSSVEELIKKFGLSKIQEQETSSGLSKFLFCKECERNMKVVRFDKSEVKRFLGVQPPVNLIKGSWVAGGSIRSWYDGIPSDDIDVYFVNSNTRLAFLTANGLSEKNLERESKYADTYVVKIGKKSHIIQAIKFYRSCVTELFSLFDFTICQFAWDGKDVFATVSAIRSSDKKHLTVNKVNDEFVLDTLKRAFEYHDRGYKLCLASMKDLIKAIAEVGPEAINHQVNYSSDGYFDELEKDMKAKADAAKVEIKDESIKSVDELFGKKEPEFVDDLLPF